MAKKKNVIRSNLNKLIHIFCIFTSLFRNYIVFFFSTLAIPLRIYSVLKYKKKNQRTRCTNTSTQVMHVFVTVLNAHSFNWLFKFIWKKWNSKQKDRMNKYEWAENGVKKKYDKNTNEYAYMYLKQYQSQKMSKMAAILHFCSVFFSFHFKK